MRIAFLLTGFYRTFVQTQAAYVHWASLYNADVYISTWDKDEMSKDKDHYTREIKQQDFADFISRVNLGGLALHDIQEYKANRMPFHANKRTNDVMQTNPRAREHGEFWANRLRDQWYLVARGWDNIAASNREYDLVFRCRLDIEVRELPLYNANCIVIPRDIGGWDYTDHMAFGDYRSMAKYCNFYHHMQEIYDLYNVDPTHAVDFPKTYLTVSDPRYTYMIDTGIRYNIIK